MKPLTIGTVAKLSCVGVETVRFYEREGLIDKPPRKESGYRQYPVETVARIKFIRRAKELGFTLKEIKELLSIRLGAGATCEDVKKRAEAKIVEIDGKIGTLESMKKSLLKLTTACGKGAAPISECPIIESLIKNGEEK